jgi:hypothetical protein
LRGLFFRTGGITEDLSDENLNVDPVGISTRQRFGDFKSHAMLLLKKKAHCEMTRCLIVARGYDRSVAAIFYKGSMQRVFIAAVEVEGDKDALKSAARDPRSASARGCCGAATRVFVPLGRRADLASRSATRGRCARSLDVPQCSVHRCAPRPAGTFGERRRIEAGERPTTVCGSTFADRGSTLGGSSISQSRHYLWHHWSR